MKSKFFALVCIAVWLGLLSVSHAQQAWVHHTGASCVTLEAVLPFFGSDCPNYAGCDAPEPGIGASNIYLGGFVSIAPRLALIAELPLARYSAHTIIPNEGPMAGIDPPLLYSNEHPSGTVLGNPLIGATYGVRDIPLSVALALRIPVTGGRYTEGELFAMNAGRFADFERKDAFTRNAMPLMTAVTYTLRREGLPHTLRLQAAGKLVLYEGNTTTNAQVYSAIADLHFAPVHVRAIYMTYTVDIATHLQDLFGLSAGIHLGRFTPGVGFRWLTGAVLPFYAHSAATANLTYRFGT